MKKTTARNCGITFLAAACAGVCMLLFFLVGCASGAHVSGMSETDNSTSYELVNEGKLTIVSALDSPPFETITDKQASGFSVELADLLAEEMGLEPEYLSPVAHDALIPTIAADKKADVAISSIVITPEVLKEVDLSDPYFEAKTTGEQFAIAVNKNNPKLTDSLNSALKSVKSNGKYDELYEKWFA